MQNIWSRSVTPVPRGAVKMLINSAGLGLRWLDRGALGPLMRFFPLLLPLADLTICLEWLVLRKRAETRGPTARETLKSLGRGGGGVCGRMVGGGGLGSRLLCFQKPTWEPLVPPCLERKWEKGAKGGVEEYLLTKKKYTCDTEVIGSILQKCS